MKFLEWFKVQNRMIRNRMIKSTKAQSYVD